jgi:hypothetical protein
MLPLEMIHDAKIDKYANINYLNPESKRVDKALARALKELVENNTKSIKVEALNKELAQQYAVRTFLEKLDGKKVVGGRLGKYFAQITGGMIGSHFGPFGAMVGAEAGNLLKGAQMAGKFSGETGLGMTKSRAMLEAIKRGKGYSKSLGSLNTTQSAKMIPDKVNIPKNISQAVAKSKTKPTIAEFKSAAKSNGKAIIIDSDTIKKGLPEYTIETDVALQPKASALAEQELKKAILADKSGIVRILGGGSGSGKSELLLPNLSNKSSVIWDGTLGNIEKAKKMIDLALSKGKSVEINPVYTPIDDAFEFSLRRGGRANVPTDELIKRHVNFRKNILELAQKYPQIKITAPNPVTGEIVENAVTLNSKTGGGSLKMFPDRESALDFLKKMVYSEDDAKSLITARERDLRTF